MELIHIANATFSSFEFQNKHSLENLASKQKLLRIFKEQTMRSLASPQITRRSAITPAHVGTNQVVRMSSRHHARCGFAGRC
jgi:hypothetical protein